MIQDSLANKDSSNSNNKKTSQELLHKKLDFAEEEQKELLKKHEEKQQGMTHKMIERKTGISVSTQKRRFNKISNKTKL